MSEPWPRLSETLTGPRAPGRCQSCGAIGGCDLWREHDRHDQPEFMFVVLCRECSNRLIEPHPRLYACMERNRPLPGTMEICLQCAHQFGLKCTHPGRTDIRDAHGLDITIADPHVAMFDGTRGGRRMGWTVVIWPEPATGCSGRTKREEREGSDG